MIFDSRIDRRRFLTHVGGLATVATGLGSKLRGKELQASRIVPGKIPDYVPGKLEMKWADEAMVRQAAELHPFDLQHRMLLASNAQTTCVDPNLGYIGYSQISLQTQPAEMRHIVGDFVDDMGRHTDSLHLTPSATGSCHNVEVVRRIAQNAMDVVDGGLAWNPPVEPFVSWWTNNPKGRPRNRWAHLPEVTRLIWGWLPTTAPPVIRGPWKLRVLW